MSDHTGAAAILTLCGITFYYHLVWATRKRRPLITRDAAVFLSRVLRVIASQERTHVLALGIVTTHIHLLVRAHPMTPVPRLLQRLKGVTSALATRELGLPPGRQLRWAPGYTIHTVSPSAVSVVRAYVEEQADRHPGEAIAGWRDENRDADEHSAGDRMPDVGCIERVRGGEV
jgi:putative transposase